MNTTLITVLKKLKDPRKRRRKRKHLLIDILILTILGVLSGADSWDAIELFGKKKYDFLKTILKLPYGIPSHDTINRVVSMIDSKQFEKLFIEWTKQITKPMHNEVVAIDGKTTRGSKDGFRNTPPIHLVSAWASDNGLSFGQVKTSDKSNEITAIPELLDMLDLKGCIISIDAMGTQKEIAKQIIEKEADYILALKSNHPFMHEDASVLFEWKTPDSIDEQCDKGHGRIENRKCEVIYQTDLLDDAESWHSLKSIIKITSSRTIGENTRTQTRFYISSARLDAKQFNVNIRKHWSIENNLHWTLDVVFNDDKQRKRNKNAAQNFALAQRIALNLLKADKSIKASIKSKRLMAAWDNDYLLSILMR